MLNPCDPSDKVSEIEWIFEDIHIKKNPVMCVINKSNDTGDNLGRLLRGIYMHL